MSVSLLSTKIDIIQHHLLKKWFIVDLGVAAVLPTYFEAAQRYDGNWFNSKIFDFLTVGWVWSLGFVSFVTRNSTKSGKLENLKRGQVKE